MIKIIRTFLEINKLTQKETRILIQNEKEEELAQKKERFIQY
jgi:hypothetical protein